MSAETQETTKLTKKQIDNRIYSSIMSGLIAKWSLARSYAKRTCKQCTGKGWFEKDRGSRLSIVQEICPCVRKNLAKEVEKL